MNFNKSPFIQIVVVLSVGLSAACAYYLHFLQLNLAQTGERLLVIGYLIILFSGLAYLVLMRFIRPRLEQFSRRAQIAWIVLALLLGAFLLLVIPIRRPALTTHHQLEIVATGQKNPASQGSEVWVTGLLLDGGDRVAASAFELDGNWELRDGVPLSHQQQPAKLRWQGAVESEAKLRLLSHP
jgi:membrane protease YdiL (CAAX protease family)